jgi:very-short-patch-repair endonuclease
MRAPSKTVVRAGQLRRKMSLPEGLLWRALRGKRLADLRFRRQHPIGPYILDFYCPMHRLCVEVDGAGHDFLERALRDERRDAWLNDQGIRVVRFRAADVLDERNLDNVAAAILIAARVPSTALRAVPLPRKRGRNLLHEGRDPVPPLRSGGGGPPKAVEGAQLPFRSTTRDMTK